MSDETRTLLIAIVVAMLSTLNYFMAKDAARAVLENHERDHHGHTCSCPHNCKRKEEDE